MAVRLCRFLVLRRPVVGEAYKFLLNLRLDEGSLPEEEAKGSSSAVVGAASGGVASAVLVPHCMVEVTRCGTVLSAFSRVLLRNLCVFPARCVSRVGHNESPAMEIP